MQQRYDTFDSLRAFACFLVIWQHVSESFADLASGGVWMRELADYADFGRVGVVAFFCISGFVIPSTFRGQRGQAVGSFLLGRFLRLYPIYWVSMVAGFFFVWQAWNRDPSLDLILKNVTMLPTLLGAPLFMGLYWTLEVEIIFYLACAALYLLCGSLKLPVLAAAFALCYFLFKNNPLLGSPGNFPVLFYHLTIMFAAACFRCVYDRLAEKREPMAIAERAGLIIALALIAYLIFRPIAHAFGMITPGGDPSWRQFALGNGLGIGIFALTAMLPTTGKFLPLIGRTTYSAYLFHAVVFNVVLKLWETQGLPQVRMEFFVLLCAGATGVLAFVTYRLIELPTIRLAKSIRNRRRKQDLLEEGDVRMGAP